MGVMTGPWGSVGEPGPAQGWLVTVPVAVATISLPAMTTKSKFACPQVAGSRPTPGGLARVTDGIESGGRARRQIAGGRRGHVMLDEDADGSDR